MSTVSSDSPKVQYSVQRELSDGSLNRVSVRVPYFSKDDIHVYVNDIEINSTATEGSEYTWRWDGDYISITPNVASGEEVLVRRITPIDEAIHIFDGRSEFDDQSMDENFQQLIYIAQEYSEGSGIKDVFSDINMHGYKIRNVGRATDDDDIVTYGQYREDAEGAKKARDDAEKHAQEALQYKQDTQGIADKALADVATAKSDAIIAINSGVDAIIDKAKVHAIAAQAAAGTAVSASNRSEVLMQNTEALADEAHTSALDALRAKEETVGIKQELQADLDTLHSIAEPVRIVATNINHVQTTSTNIDDISLVSSDLEGSFSQTDYDDYGDLGNPGAPSTTIVGGNIKVVAENIDSVRTVAGLSKDFATVIASVETVTALTSQAQASATNAKTSADSARASATEANNSANSASVSVVNAENSAMQAEANAKTANTAATSASTSAKAASTKATEASSSATNAKSYSDNAKASADRAEQAVADISASLDAKLDKTTFNGFVDYGDLGNV